MNRLIEKTVFSGLVIACRLATCPTRISPSFVNPTTDGVSRLPSWFAMTVGLPPSTTETTEFVVPRSIPMTFAISLRSRSPSRGAGTSFEVRRGPRWPLRSSPWLEDVDLDFLRLELFGLRQPDLQDAVPVGRLHTVGLHGHRQLDQPLELSVGPLDVEEILLLDLLLEAPLTLDREQVARDRHGHVLLIDPRQLERQDEVVLRGVHVHGWRPHPPARSRRTTNEAVEEAVHLTLDVLNTKPLPLVHG